MKVNWAQPGPISDDHVLWVDDICNKSDFATALHEQYGLTVSPDDVSYSPRRYEEVDGYT